MEWTISAGNTKKSQIKDLERFCKYHKEGNKYVIDEIFETPLPKEDNKRNSVYAENVDKLVIHICSKTQDSIYHYSEFSKTGFLKELCIINKNYRVGRRSMDRFSRYLEVPIETIYDFYNTFYRNVSDILEGSLNRLKKRCLIDWYKVTKVKPVNETYRKATDGELEGIKEIEQEVLKEFNCSDKGQILRKGKSNDFYNRVDAVMKELMGLEYSFQVYHVVNTKAFRKMLLDDLERENAEFDLNYDIQKSAIESAKRRHDKLAEAYKPSKTLMGRPKAFGEPYLDKHKNILSDTYVDDTKKVVRICIDMIDPIELAKILIDIPNKKYTYAESTRTEFENEWYEMLNDKEYYEFDDLL